MSKWTVVLPFLLNLLSHRVFAAADVPLSFSPPSLALPPTQTVELVADLGSSPLAFAHVELSFDPNFIRVDGDISTTPSLSTVVRKTSPDEANRTGKIVLALALPPGDRSSPPMGTVTLAELSLASANSGTTSQTSALAIDPERTQLVTLTERLLTSDAASLSVTVRPAPRTAEGCADALRPRITRLRDLFGWIRTIWRSCGITS